ncbi:MAG TPA: DEAD/DEAH box helicase [Spirochaetia bacterium]|nr:DEAD/DEAH box helicase [Spirochaetia bacterium]
MHSNANHSNVDFLQLLRKAGFPPPTPQQEKLTPLILRGRDIIVEEIPGTDTTTTVLLPLILGLRGAGLAPHALFLLPTSNDVARISQAAGRFTRVLRDVPAFVALGEIEDARREQRRLEKGATIIAGTTERIIDHIRRGSLDVRDLAAVVVQDPEGEGRADIVTDEQFIFARLTGRHQTVLFSSHPPGEENELAALLRHPIVLPVGPAVGASLSAERENLVFATGDGDRAQALARVLLGRRIPTALVLCSPRADPQRIAETLRRRALRAVVWTGGPQGRPFRGGGDSASISAVFSRGDVDVVITSAIPAFSRDESEGFSPSHVVYLDFPAGGSRSVRWTSNVIVLMDRGQDREISRLQEAIGVSLKKEDLPTDDEVVTGSIDRILRNLRDEKDRAELARLRSQIRRQVPLLQRPVFMAFLLKTLLPPRSAPVGVPQRPAKAGNVDAPGRRETQPAQTARAARGRFGRSVEVPRAGKPAVPALSRPEFTQLFVSIGRNRRVYARELTELFTEKLQLGANELGSVRVFDKYSFVDINPARADEAITKLSGSEMKGRTITVNYAKKKEEKEQR